MTPVKSDQPVTIKIAIGVAVAVIAQLFIGGVAFYASTVRAEERQSALAVRVSKTETTLETVRTDVSDMKGDIREIKTNLDFLVDTVKRNNSWRLGNN